MKPHFHPTWAIIGLMLIAYPSSAQKFIKIDRGIIKDDFTITIISKYLRNKEHVEIPLTKQVVINPQQFFNLADLGLEATDNRLMMSDPKYFGDWYKDYKHRSWLKDDIIYNITITKNGKLYYGKIAFYNAMPGAKGQAVTNYYEIKIPENYFEEATSGKVSFTYEYYVLQGANSPTWLIWLSDVPF